MNDLSSNGTKVHATKLPPPVVIGVRLKKTTAEVLRAASEPLGGGPKQEMTVISRRSIKNAVEVLTNSDEDLNSMVVATYPGTFPDDGRIVKCHHKRLLQAIDRKLGDYSYFTAFEYQKRGAPHFHSGLSVNLSDVGEVTTLYRKKVSRRKPTFLTVKPLQDWAFETWVEIISKPNPVYGGEVLEWPGVDDEDVEQMRKAYYDYNAGFSWEVMREKNGATRYFVKELTGLKLYQKTIPEGYKHPGRHFLYSDDMRFDPKNALTFILSGEKLRELLETSGWKFIPEDGKPLYKHLWNAAANLGIALVEAGYRAVEGTLEAIKRFDDLRFATFADMSAFKFEIGQAILEEGIKIARHWNTIKKGLDRQAYWESIFATGPP